MVSDSCDEETAKRSEEINKRKKRSGRNALLSMISGGALMLGSVLYLNPHPQVKDYYDKVNQTIGVIERTVNRERPTLPIIDSVIADNFSRAIQHSDEQRKSLEISLQRAYQIKNEIENTFEYKEFMNYKFMSGLAAFLGGLLVLGGYLTLEETSRKSIGAVPVVSRPKS